MKIRNARPARRETSPGGFRTLARFAFEPVEGVLIFDCTIVEAPDGKLLVYGPSSKTSQQVLSLAPDVRSAIINMTLAEVYDDAIANAA
ncbi:hypothetical protein [Neorhizobium sp. T7_12]|uniref:hypothetical protein n=1 Tax=Neorhizobium sp. T7_12 TaxID=2093832 RepID=UPI000CF8A78F|nr:hypothetical protein [Neorhizobium sp. T7_12]